MSDFPSQTPYEPHVFEKTVREMRAAQKEYFRGRDKNVLEKSKRLEREVDIMLAKKDLNTSVNLNDQISLF